MKAVRFFPAIILGMFILTGCGQDAATPIAETGPTAEAPEITSKDFGDYVVHFNAISTDSLQPEVARTYDIVRSKNRAMLNVSIIKKVENTIGQSVSGSVSATANNLTGQLKNLTLREIREGDAIYFIGDVAIANAETLVFNIDVTPINETSRFSMRFSRQFFTD